MQLMFRFMIASLAAWAVMAAMAMALFGYLLADYFEPLRTLFRPAEEQAETSLWAQLAQFIRTFFFTGVILFLRGARPLPVVTGAAYGFLAGLFVSTYHAVNSASLPLPFETAAAWAAFDTILLTTGGAVFAFLFRPPRIKSV
ncbi:MAG: hypothetical protein Tsb0010_19020 [Parvularculaceae bacterium]